MADLDPAELDLIVVATGTPDHPGFPATGSLVQEALGASRAGAFDVGAGCAAFGYGLVVGAQFVQSGALKNVLVVGSDVMSRIIDWRDRGTCVLFGDGAGAVVLQRRTVRAGCARSCSGRTAAARRSCWCRPAARSSQPPRSRSRRVPTS